MDPKDTPPTPDAGATENNQADTPPEGDAAAAPAAAAGGKVDIDAILAKINIPPQLKPMYDKVLLRGMTIMFSKETHDRMFLAQLQKPGPLDGKIAEGIIALMYLLWTGSNQTIPPQLIVPLTLTLTLKAFDFLQKSDEPDATPETLGSAVEKAVTGIMQKFGVPPDQIEQIVAQQKQAVSAAGASPDAAATPPAQ